MCKMLFVAYYSEHAYTCGYIKWFSKCFIAQVSDNDFKIQCLLNVVLKLDLGTYNIVMLFILPSYLEFKLFFSISILFIRMKFHVMEFLLTLCVLSILLLIWVLCKYSSTTNKMAENKMDKIFALSGFSF